jgi:hypothetical protein
MYGADLVMFSKSIASRKNGGGTWKSSFMPRDRSREA